MHGTELIHMVALIGAAAGVHEACLASYEQRGLMHADGVGTGKQSASLAVFERAVGENKRVMGSEPFLNHSSLPDVTVAYDRRRIHNPVFNYESVGIDPRADTRQCPAMGGIVDYGSVAE